MSTGKPIYPLSQVCDLAKSGKVGFSAKAQDGFRGLGFTIDEARECVAWISEDEFLKSHDYELKRIFDAYITRRRHDGELQRIYIKLKINEESPVRQVYVTSFHAPDY